MKSLAQGVSHYKPAGRRLYHDGKGSWEDSPPELGSVAPLLLCCALSICLHSLLLNVTIVSNNSITEAQSFFVIEEC